MRVSRIPHLHRRTALNRFSSAGSLKRIIPLTTVQKQATISMAAPERELRYADIGINLTDPVYRGLYHGKKGHDDDFVDVLKRAVDAGCKKLMVTGSDLQNSKEAIKLAGEHIGLCYATVGVHPCSAKQFETHPGGPLALMAEIEKLALDAKSAGHAVAFGEIGLDYDRLFLAPKDAQLGTFEMQLEAAVRVQLPLFLHSRAAGDDFEKLLGAKLLQLPKRGLVHSFTGTLEEMQRLVAMGLDIGVNGCSLKTEENLAVVKDIPLEHLQIETDGPWCEMRSSHASAKHVEKAPPLVKAVKKEKFTKGVMVKGRNEPAMIPRVAYAIASVKDIPVEDVAEAAWRNSIAMFGLGEKCNSTESTSKEDIAPEQVSNNK